jgi:hypothetical protein
MIGVALVAATALAGADPAIPRPFARSSNGCGAARIGLAKSRMIRIAPARSLRRSGKGGARRLPAMKARCGAAMPRARMFSG